MLEGNDEELISPITSLFQKLNINCFNLLYHIKYHHLRVYKYQAFIYILKNIKIQSQKLTKKTKKNLLINYKNNSIYQI